MFHSARIKLTAWYVLIIMLISIAFSVVVYKALTQEFDRILRMERLRQQGQLPLRHTFFIFQEDPNIPTLRGNVIFTPDPELIAEAKGRLITFLILVNGGILVVAGGAAYFLAGRTLQPIQEMVDEQNRFISDSSHELRTPLTSMKTEIEVVLREAKLTIKDAKKVLESSLEEVNNLQDLSDNLIKLTQYQKGKNGLHFEKIQLDEVIGNAIKRVEKLARHKQIVVTNNSKSLSLIGDLQSLTDLFVIFLDNAIKYSPNKKSIIINAKRVDHLVEVSFKDHGFGIPEEDIPHLFDRFYRGDKSRAKSTTSGYGLGLSIAQQIVERHNGTIRVESKLHKSTTFTVRLPIKQ